MRAEQTAALLALALLAARLLRGLLRRLLRGRLLRSCLLRRRLLRSTLRLTLAAANLAGNALDDDVAVAVALHVIHIRVVTLDVRRSELLRLAGFRLTRLLTGRAPDVAALDVEDVIGVVLHASLRNSFAHSLKPSSGNWG